MLWLRENVAAGPALHWGTAQPQLLCSMRFVHLRITERRKVHAATTGNTPGLDVATPRNPVPPSFFSRALPTRCTPTALVHGAWPVATLSYKFTRGTGWALSDWDLIKLLKCMHIINMICVIRMAQIECDRCCWRGCGQSTGQIRTGGYGPGLRTGPRPRDSAPAEGGHVGPAAAPGRGQRSPSNLLILIRRQPISSHLFIRGTLQSASRRDPPAILARLAVQRVPYTVYTD